MYVCAKPQTKEKGKREKMSYISFFLKNSYWQCFFHFWVISVFLLHIFLVLTDNWPNINYRQQSAQLQGSLMGVDISSSLKHQW